MPNISAWLNGDDEFSSVVSLSAILEQGILPQRFFLSAKACAGILRRAARRGKELHTQLRLALQAVAGA